MQDGLLGHVVHHPQPTHRHPQPLVLGLNQQEHIVVKSFGRELQLEIVVGNMGHWAHGHGTLGAYLPGHCARTSHITWRRSLLFQQLEQQWQGACRQWLSWGGLSLTGWRIVVRSAVEITRADTSFSQLAANTLINVFTIESYSPHPVKKLYDGQPWKRKRKVVGRCTFLVEILFFVTDLQEMTFASTEIEDLRHRLFSASKVRVNERFFPIFELDPLARFFDARRQVFVTALLLLFLLQPDRK